MRRRWSLLAAPAALLLFGGCSHDAPAPAATDGATSDVATATPGVVRPVEPAATVAPLTTVPAPVVTAPSIPPSTQATTPAPQASGNSDVVPVITFAAVRGSSIEVDGYVPGILEIGGRCTATLVASDGTVTASAPAEADATTVWCSKITLATPAARARGWTVTLRYSSAKHDGVSAPTPVAAP